MNKIDLSIYIDITKNNLKTIFEKLRISKNRQVEIMNFFEKNIEKDLVIFIGGSQISGSISPFMHNYTACENDYPLSYVLFPINEDKFKISELMEFIEKKDNLVGVNVSMPYKLEVYEYLKNRNCLDKSAFFAGAVNTIVKKDGKLIGYNTDIDGIINPIIEKLNSRFCEENPPTLLYQGGKIYKPLKGYVFGAGGASRAVIGALLMLGVKEIVVFNRSDGNLIETKSHFYSDEVKEILKSYGNVDYKIETIIYDVAEDNSFIGKFIDKTGILVNTLPFGFKENLPKYSIKLDEIDEIFKNIKLYFDIVYDLNYGGTPMEQYVKQNYKNIFVCNGVDMVIGQAKKGFELWTNGCVFDTNLIKSKINFIY
ncbi:MAG: hypothetical protein PHN31_03295 [Candidatus Gracilibacteria bacterium]|nr:hypothetical protein [Candidatus Gracilibacteria bacterium]